MDHAKMSLSCFIVVLVFSALASPVIGVDEKHVLNMEKSSLGAQDMGSSLTASNGSNVSGDTSSYETNSSALPPLYDNGLKCLEDVLSYDAMDRAVSACQDERSGDLHYDFHLPWLYKMQHDLTKLRDVTIDYTTSSLHKIQHVLCITEDATIYYLYETRLKTSLILSHWSHQIQEDLMHLISAVDKKAAEYDYFWLYKVRDFLVAMDKVAAACNIAYALISYKVFWFCVAFYKAVSKAIQERRGGYQPVRFPKRNNKRQQKRRRRHRR